MLGYLMIMDLYIKPGCPWCVDAVKWLDDQGYVYNAHDVISDSAKMDEMIAITGQSLAPCLRISKEGREDLVLPDFGTDELIAFLKKHELSA